MRYTDEQRNLAEGMEILINLYYRLKETDQTEWMTEPVIQSIAELAYKVIPEFTTCLYLKRSRKPQLKFFKGSGGIINLTENDFQKFVAALDAFPGERKTQTISILGVSYEFSKPNDLNRAPDKTKWTMPNSVYRDSQYFSMKALIPGSWEDRPGTGHYTGMVSSPLYHEAIRLDVNPESTFAKTLYRSPNSPGYLDATSPYTQSGNTFLGLIRYFLAKYIDAFGSFNRIAQCEYESCKKLIYDIRSGRRHFCSDLCRKKAHDALQDPVKLSCQNKQNVWIRRKAGELSINPYTVYKDRCDQCDHPVEKGGLCPILRGRNKKMYAAWEQQKKLPRKRLHSEKFDKKLRPSRL